MSLFSTLGTGYSGLKASETAIAVTSHNIANANNDYYTRQRISMEASIPFHSTPGDIGSGVSVTTIVRVHDEFVYSRLKDSSNALSYDTFSKKTLEETAKYFPDLAGVGIASNLESYYSSWGSFASNTNDSAQKIALVQSAITFSENLKETRGNVRALQDSMNDQLLANMTEVNSIGSRIANLNKDIARVETIEPNRANDLRDQRDKLELTLAELLDFSVFKGNIISQNNIDANLTDQGKDYYLNIAGNSFVDGATFHPLVIDNTGNETNYYSIYSESQDRSRIDITGKILGGKVGAILDLRGRDIDKDINDGYPADGVLQGYVDDLDVFAKTFIQETNNIYAQSAQTRMQSSVLNNVADNEVLLDTDLNLKAGDFDVVVYDNAGNEIARKTITIGISTTMRNDTYSDSLLTQFNSNTDDNVDNNTLNDLNDYFGATYSANQLNFEPINPSLGYRISIESNDTNFAGATGMSEFFSGDSAKNISVKSDIKNDPTIITGFKAPVDGNNDVANSMVQMQYDRFDFVDSSNRVITETMSGFYRALTTSIATDGENSARSYETSSALFNTVNTEFLSISGVSTDEELTNLIKYQASYGANAKVITTLDQMLDTLLGIKA
ncbi:MAG: flagellar hook-associated protein FlgK [Sulfurospirillaceae bacterium]|nr:flagellar hook-associated protein FlgK [Sulfurospirillaceae bacterium]